MKINVKRLHPDAVLPTRAHITDAGADLYSVETVRFYHSGQRILVPTGIAIEVPVGHVGLVHPRSGLAVSKGLTVTNAPGTIDADYRGEVKVIMHLIGGWYVEPVTLEAGTRIAQLVVQQIELPEFQEVDELVDTKRGGGGFGSTGV